jgi:rod shape-determining protein MreB
VITSEEVREAISVPVEAVIAAVRDTLDRTPPELASDIMNRGMVLAGGGALLSGLEERLRRETSVPVHMADEPMACVVVGSGHFLEEIDFYRGAVSSG